MEIAPHHQGFRLDPAANWTSQFAGQERLVWRDQFGLVQAPEVVWVRPKSLLEELDIFRRQIAVLDQFALEFVDEAANRLYDTLDGRIDRDAPAEDLIDPGLFRRGQPVLELAGQLHRPLDVIGQRGPPVVDDIHVLLAKAAGLSEDLR